MSALVQVRNVTKKYGGLTANNDITIRPCHVAIASIVCDDSASGKLNNRRCGNSMPAAIVAMIDTKQMVHNRQHQRASLSERTINEHAATINAT